MEYQVLARKWRPSEFSELIGQAHIAKTLQNSIERDRIAHAYLFTGVRGVGKTSTARILAKALNCESGPTPSPCSQCPSCKAISSGASLEVLEIDGASNTGVDDVRELKENIQYLPVKGKYKIYIIDEVHMLSKAAFNALLKTLEEPPSGIVFIFATTEPHKLPDTIVSRCQRFDFKRVSRDVIAKQLRKISESEGIDVSDTILYATAREAQGSVRDALTLFDRLISYCGMQIPDEEARELLGLVDRSSMMQLLQHVVAGDTASAVKDMHAIYFAGYELRRFLESLLEEIRHALLIKVGLKASEISLTADEVSELEGLFAETTQIELERYFDLVKRAILEMHHSQQETYLVETTVIKMCHVRGDFMTVREALSLLQGDQHEVKKSIVDRRQNPKSRETIEDPYVKETVGLFDAKIEKIQIQNKD